VTDSLAHILLLLSSAALIAFVVAVLLTGRARLRRRRQTAEPNAMTLDDSIRADTVNAIIDRKSHGCD
jgi:hypothetical protein